MIEKYLPQTEFSSQEDFIKNFRINVPENFNFGYDIVDGWAAEEPDRKALLWTNDHGQCIQFTFADMKKYTDMTATETPLRILVLDHSPAQNRGCSHTGDSPAHEKGHNIPL